MTPVGGTAGVDNLLSTPAASSLQRWRLSDAIGATLRLERDLRAAGATDEADVVKRMRGRLRAMREGLAVVGPTGKLVSGAD